jgi:hypothetical protein
MFSRRRQVVHLAAARCVSEYAPLGTRRLCLYPTPNTANKGPQLTLGAKHPSSPLHPATSSVRSWFRAWQYSPAENCVVVPQGFLIFALFDFVSGLSFKNRKFFNSDLFWLNSHPFFARPIICRLNLSVSVVNKGTTRELAHRSNWTDKGTYS